MKLSLSDAELRAKAEELGLIKPGEAFVPSARSRAAAALLQEQRPRTAAAAPVARSIVVRPGESVEVDGQPFPWVIQSDAIEVTLDPSGKGLVRLTIPTQSVQIIKPESEIPR